jgi:hypothetical protein
MLLSEWRFYQMIVKHAHAQVRRRESGNRENPDGNHREVCIDRMYFDKDGNILPVKITKTGVEKRVLKK